VEREGESSLKTLLLYRGGLVALSDPQMLSVKSMGSPSCFRELECSACGSTHPADKVR